MALAEAAYGLGVRLVRAASPPLAGGGSKLARGIRGRRSAVPALCRWAREERDPGRVVAWFHAPSVGEGLQARAVMEALRRLRPDVQLVFTFFSPSAERLAAGMPAEASAYLPWDVPGDVRVVLDALEPALLVFTKTEVWPVLAREARARGAATVLVAGTLPPGAGRLRWPARQVLAPSFRGLAALAAISPDDAARFRRLGVRGERVVVTGDPAIDSASERSAAAGADAPYLRPFREAGRSTLVAGSTWEPDERVLIRACARVRERHPSLRVVLAPHEPDPPRVRALVAAFQGAGFATGTLAEIEAAGSAEGRDAVVVDRVGVLAHLYTVGEMAYVGGGFHRHGLHSVLEPAAAGVPVAFGPMHENARAAADLLARGGALEVASAEELARAVARWLDRPGEAGAAGERARHYIQEHRGASERTARALVGLLSPA